MYATATLIGSRVILTSGHAVFNKVGYWEPGTSAASPKHITVFNAGTSLNASTGKWTQPFGWRRVTWYRVSSNWFSGSDWAFDWALLTLSSNPLPGGDHLGFKAKSGPALKVGYVNMIGYALNTSKEDIDKGWTGPVALNGIRQWLEFGPIEDVYEWDYRYRCRTWGGSSGGPILHGGFGGVDVVGVNKGNPYHPSDNTKAFGVRINDARATDWASWIAMNGGG